MKIGYACICLGVQNTKMRTCTQKYATEEKILEIIAHNFNALKHILYYNIQHDIKIFRLSSDLVPFASSPVNELPWQQLFQKELEEIGAIVKEHGLRVSMHPGQYTILNSPREDVVERAVLDLQYHADILDCMCLDATHKLILHIGGIYNDKELAIERFINVYATLSTSIKQRLVIENDDRYYTLEDVLYISKSVGIPVIFDNLHHEILHGTLEKEEGEWLRIVNETWKEKDGRQKIHYAQQEPKKRRGAHSQTINTAAFLAFINRIGRQDIDIMLEVKDKNLSAKKCINVVFQNHLQVREDWEQYRFFIMLRSYHAYWFLNQLVVHDKFSIAQFYSILDHTMKLTVQPLHYERIFQLLHDTTSQYMSEKEKLQVHKFVDAFIQGAITPSRIKLFYLRIASREQLDDMINDYLFLE